MAKAAEESGVATRPIQDLEAYRQQLTHYVYHTGLIMKPVFSAAKAAPKRVAYAEGEEERVLRAVQGVVDEGLAKPILIGRPHVIQMRIEKAGLRLRPGVDFELINPEDDPRYRAYHEAYHALRGRDGVTPDMAKVALRRSNTLIGTMLMHMGDADALLCGTVGRFEAHLEHVRDVIGLAPGAKVFAAMNALMLEEVHAVHHRYLRERGPDRRGTGCHHATGRRGNPAFRPASEGGDDVALDVRLVEPPVGTQDARRRRDPGQGGPAAGSGRRDAGRCRTGRGRARHFLPNTKLAGSANLLVMPTLDAANIAFNLLKITGGQGVTVGPILLGAAKPVHILNPQATTRRIVNMTAVAVAGRARCAKSGAARWQRLAGKRWCQRKTGPEKLRPGFFMSVRWQRLPGLPARRRGDCTIAARCTAPALPR